MADRSIHIRYTKWDGSLHWHFDARPLERDDHGTWVVVPPGGTYRRGAEPVRTDEHGFVVLVPDREWWTATFNAVARGRGQTVVYVDIDSAVEWKGDTAHLIDLDLDVTRAADGSVRLLDEDEFDEHRVDFSYPPDVVDRVRATAATVFGMLERDDEPFGAAWKAALARGLGWAHGTVVAGHGVASGIADDPRFPDGTLAEQWPHLVAAGLELDGLARATINVELSVPAEPHSPRAHLEHLVWKPGYPAETFDVCDARIAVQGSVHRALWYRPDPATKPDHHQPEGVVELLAPPLPGITDGTPVSVWLDPDQATFVV